MNNVTPTRSWYAKKLPLGRYQVLCRHTEDGIEEDCGTTGPDCSRDELLTWFLGQARPQEPLLINDFLPRQELLS